MKLCAVDVETIGDVPAFRSAAIFSDERKEYVESHRDLISLLREHARKKYVFLAHNAEYDCSIVFWNAGEPFSLHYVNDTYDCGYWDYGNKSRRAQVWDTVKLSAGMSLASLGEAMELPKYPTPAALLGIDDPRASWLCKEHDMRECLECYNLRDAEITWSFGNMLREWLESNGSAMRKSLAAIAIDLWKLWDVGQQQPIRSRELRELGRLAYHGGRNECFRYGSLGYVTSHDFPSFYNHILTQITVPDCQTLRYRESGVRWQDIANLDGVVEASVWVWPQHIPPLPCVTRERVYYPVGTFRGAWPIRELQHACDHGAEVLEVHRAAYTDVLVNPFSTFASGLLALREDALARHDPREMAYKFIANALPGRLGMRDAQTRRIYKRWRPHMPEAEQRGYELESTSNAVFLAREIVMDKPSQTSNIVWASCVTGKGRTLLHNELLLAGQNACYCDTDSVHSTNPQGAPVRTVGTLSQTGLWESALYFGPKLYSLVNDLGQREVRAKGIPRDRAEQYLDSGHIEYKDALSVREAIAQGLPAGTWIDVRRQMGYGIGNRTIHDPTVLRDRSGYSPTSPVVMTLGSDGGVSLTNDLITST